MTVLESWSDYEYHTISQSHACRNPDHNNASLCPTMTLLAQECVSQRDGDVIQCVVDNKFVCQELKPDYAQKKTTAALCVLKIAGVPAPVVAKLTRLSFHANLGQKDSPKAFARLSKAPRVVPESVDPVNQLDLFQLSLNRSQTAKQGDIYWYLHVEIPGGHKYEIKIDTRPQLRVASKKKRKPRAKREGDSPLAHLRDAFRTISEVDLASPPTASKRRKQDVSSPPATLAPSSPVAASSSTDSSQVQSLVPEGNHCLQILAEDKSHTLHPREPTSATFKYRTDSPKMQNSPFPPSDISLSLVDPNGEFVAVQEGPAQPTLEFWQPAQDKFFSVEFPKESEIIYEWVNVCRRLTLPSGQHYTIAFQQTYRAQLKFSSASPPHRTYNIVANVNLHTTLKGAAEPVEDRPSFDDRRADRIYALLIHSIEIGVPLHCFSASSFLNVVSHLLECGYDPLQPARFGLTPLHLAAWRGSFAVTEILLKHMKSDRDMLHRAVEFKDLWGNTPFDVAAAYGRYDIVSLFIFMNHQMNLLSESEVRTFGRFTLSRSTH
jgi:hypothetical protein